MPGRTIAASAVKRWRALAVAIAVASCSIVLQPACIFFVGDPGPLQSTRCSFKGDGFNKDGTTTCGMCIASSCQSSVDACCGTSSCQGELMYLDGCAGGTASSSSACYTLATGDDYSDTSGKFTTLGSCVAQNCAAMCSGSSGNSDAGSGVTCVSSGAGGCSCVAISGASSGTPECDPAAVGGNGVCCASVGYPNSLSPGANSCTCTPYACQADGTGNCYCSASPDVLPGLSPTGVCDNSGGGVCCVNNEGLCSCLTASSDCGGGTVFEECTPSGGACPENETLIASCSNPNE